MGECCEKSTRATREDVLGNRLFCGMLESKIGNMSACASGSSKQ